ncbi:hypothetical protein GOV12_03745 [Candidatus Pacearchaeota archaeon]|nr:hypothetical protein [Candidatus Pacearchaeota archaeon]
MVMDLTDVYFDFETRERRFKNISYRFNVTHDLTTIDGIVNKGRESLDKLNGFVSKIYNQRFIQKSDEGEVSDREINFSYSYFNSSFLSMFFRGIISVSTSYSLKIGKENMPEQLELYLRCMDRNQKRLLLLHDSVLLLPELVIEDDALSSLRKIKYLREKGLKVKDIRKYLKGTC